MTDQDLRTLLREHVTADEPAFLLRAEDSVRPAARARRRRWTAGLVAAGVALGGVGVVVADRHGGAGDTVAHDRVDPRTTAALAAYDPAVLPALLDSEVRATLGDLLPDGAVTVTATDDALEELPRSRWREASAVRGHWGGDGDRQVDVRLAHGRGEAEGDRERSCAAATSGPDAILVDCDVTTLPDGSVAVTEVVAALAAPERSGLRWITLARDDLRSGRTPLWSLRAGGGRFDPDQVFFLRSVEVVHSETFLTNAQEIVRAPSYDVALDAFAVPVELLAAVATDPELVIPEPAKAGTTPTTRP